MNYRVHRASFTVVREPGQRRRLVCDGPEKVAQVARGVIPDDAREHFVTLLLDNQNVLVATVEVSTGSLSATLVHPREVFGPALRLMGVASLILVHNHPSGDPTPSREDIRLTRQLVECGQLLDVRVHDHIVLGNGTAEYLSFAQRGML